MLDKKMLIKIFLVCVICFLFAPTNDKARGQEWEQITEMKLGADEEILPVALSVDSLGNIITAGKIGNNSYIIKYKGTDGNILWTYSLIARLVSNLVIDSSNNFFVVSFSPIGADTYCFTSKVNGTDGSLLWEKSFIGAAPALAKDGQGNVIVSARSGGNYYTVKYSGIDGTILWETNIAGANSESAPSVVVDPFENIIVSGITKQSSFVYSYETIKYDGANGSIIWQQTKGSNDWFLPINQSLTSDRNGDVIITTAPNYTTNYQITKYSGLNGSLIWEKVFDNISIKIPKLVLVDSNNDVIVADSPHYTDVAGYRLGKYRSKDGNIIWEQIFETDGVATGMILDFQNNTIITGDSGYTVKYQSEDGNLSWRKWYFYYWGSLNIMPGKINAIALDPANNVIVTGKSDIEVYKGSDLFASIITKKYLNSSALMPDVKTNPVTDIIGAYVSHAHATLNGEVRPNGDITYYWFEIGTDNSYSYDKTEPKPVGDGWNPIQVTENIAVGQYNVTYHVRLVASNIMGTIYGEDQTFNPGSPPDACDELPTPEQRQACRDLRSTMSGGSGGGCFIATAAFGSPMAKELEPLKNFRDNFLLKNSLGRKLVKAYYEKSPPIADFIKEHKLLKKSIKIALFPVVYGVNYPKVFFLILLLSSFSVWNLFRYKKGRKGRAKT